MAPGGVCPCSGHLLHNDVWQDVGFSGCTEQLLEQGGGHCAHGATQQLLEYMGVFVLMPMMGVGGHRWALGMGIAAAD